jgi:opacity protein-like surface antigen
VTDHIFGRLEYRFTAYSSKAIEDLVAVGLKQNAVSVGIGFKFY